MTRAERRRILNGLTETMNAITDTGSPDALSDVLERVNDATELLLSRWSDLLDGPES